MTSPPASARAPGFALPPVSWRPRTAPCRRVCPTSGAAVGVHRGRAAPTNDIRPELRRLAAYTPILPHTVVAASLGIPEASIIKLDANENPYGASAAATAALAATPYLHVYPDPESRDLRSALAAYTGVDAAHILVGAGADELIDLLFRLLVTPGAGDTVVNFPPTFGMYQFDADVNGAEVISLGRGGDCDAANGGLDGDFRVPIEAVEAVFARAAAGECARPKMVFVASPNNPDGSLLPDADLERLLALPTLVVLDEAYMEFSGVDRAGLVPRHPNLVVLRTFSKWAGLAGLRVGYGLFPLGLMEHLWKCKQPYNVSVAAQAAATAAVQAASELAGQVAAMVAQRERFFVEAKALPWLTPYPSAANYVLCRVAEGGGRTARGVKEALFAQGILVRYYTSPGLSDCIRISMGTPEQMDKVFSALAKL